MDNEYLIKREFPTQQGSGSLYWGMKRICCQDFFISTKEEHDEIGDLSNSLVLIFDLTNGASFNFLIKKFPNILNDAKTPILLVGNKCDVTHSTL